MMNTQYFKNITENGTLPHNNTTPSTYMFGQNDTNATPTPREWFIYEERITSVWKSYFCLLIIYLFLNMKYDHLSL